MPWGGSLLTCIQPLAYSYFTDDNLSAFALRILFIAKKLNVEAGGSNFSLKLIATELSYRGYDVDILTLRPGSNQIPSQDRVNILTPQREPPSYSALMRKFVYDEMRNRKDDTDLFHIFNPKYIAPAGIFCKNYSSTPIVARLNMYSMFCVNSNRMDVNCPKNCTTYRKIKNKDTGLLKNILSIPMDISRTFVDGNLGANIDRFLAISPTIKDIYAENGLPSSKIELVPNFYDPDFLDVEQEVNVDHLFSAENDLKILYVGRLDKTKGIDLLIKALNQVPGTELIVVGQGDEMDHLRSLSASLGLQERIQFAGHVAHDGLHPFYKEADIFVHPCRWPEPFGRTLLESFQNGTPAVVSDAGAPSWVVGDAGMTFRSGDVEDLAGVLRRLEDDRDIIGEMSTHCDERLRMFHPERILDRITSIYEDL